MTCAGNPHPRLTGVVRASPLEAAQEDLPNGKA
jgi:hypothetical protein